MQGPCPFRIEVTNSETGTSSPSKWSCNKLVQPQPPTAPADREDIVVTPNPRKATKYYPPDPSHVLFGATTYEAGERSSNGNQRAPTNTTPVRGDGAVDLLEPFLPTLLKHSISRLIHCCDCLWYTQDLPHCVHHVTAHRCTTAWLVPPTGSHCQFSYSSSRGCGFLPLARQ